MLLQNKRAKVFVVIPAYNETLILKKVVDNLLGYDYTVVVVNDGSDDFQYADIKNGPLFILTHNINLGQGAAIQTGMEFALSKGAEIIITFDADGQHNPEDIDRLIKVLHDSGSDIVLGSRFLKHASDVPVKRRILLHVARYVNFLFTGLLLTDAHNGLRAIKANTAKKINLQENRMAHATEILWHIKKQKLHYVEVPVQIIYTAYSQGKGQKPVDGVRILFDLFLNKFFK
jgi:glycosyltransferase involved in cell wall biosynthesis